ncbi:MAG: hypothetical protein IH991_24790 [Planctomycetes bacterium]|nr:hypothetical protein [Planctomycetota bacterium]
MSIKANGKAPIDMLDHLSKQLGVNITIDFETLTEAKISLSIELEFDVEDVSLHAAPTRRSARCFWQFRGHFDGSFA